MSKNRRKLKNLVQKPTLQYSHALYYFAFLVVGAVMTQVFLVGSLQRMMVEAMLASGVDPLRLQMALSGQFRDYTLRVVLIFPVLGLGAMYFALRITHRFLGPQVPMQRHVRALIDGDYGSQCHLRKGDELQELSESLNELAEALQRRHGSQSRQIAA